MNVFKAATLCVIACAPFSKTESQDAESCAVFAAALRQIVPDTVKAIVVYDSVSLATPSFAFRAWTSMGLPKADSKVPLTDSLWNAMRSGYKDREALPGCFGAGKQVVRLPYQSIIDVFKDRANGWDNFKTAYPAAVGFLVVGRPFFIDANQTDALVYIAQATHWLAGSGRIIYLHKENGVWTVVGTHSLWVS